ncbi:hypothetical protein B0I35DRAFT_434858 [Stachybotrys elegans]|uniref:Uncharacterized protein n=1 Tax=Stachybotrys elegans TaxID=80388 RepID=A0A8K0SLJ5_9HYPO|nr:hypothetical protein B0I35DRAFT_434858 [Stachybotrys elegans]
MTCGDAQSSFLFGLSAPPSIPESHDRPGTDILAAGGYSLPSTVTRGWQVHHWSSGTPESADGMWFPQPRHVFFEQVGQLAPKHIFNIRYLVTGCSRGRCWLYCEVKIRVYFEVMRLRAI